MGTSRAHKTETVIQRAPPPRLGPYEPIAELGRGGMGRVYLTRRVGEAGFERLFAVKVVLEQMEQETEAVLMLLDEARIASMIHHPNVVPILDTGHHEGRPFVVMDYVEGCSLSELLRRTRDHRPPRLLVPLLLDALRGLHAAHELVGSDGEPLELIHRDFSPPNLLVSVDGICRVTDFGVVKARARLTHTRQDIQKGKLSYMAPEQIEGRRDLDRRVDLWSAGVVIWYALTGEHPFRGDSPASTIQMILSRPIPRPSTIGLEPPACFDELCLGAIERDRSRRWATAQELADELQRVAIRQNLLAPQSEVGAWVRSLFVRELAERRQMVRALTEQRRVRWQSAPVLPGMTTTSSTKASGRPSPRSAAHPRGGRSRAVTAALRAIGVTLTVLLSVAVGFSLVTAALLGLFEPRSPGAREAPRQSTVTAFPAPQKLTLQRRRGHFDPAEESAEPDERRGDRPPPEGTGPDK